MDCSTLSKSDLWGLEKRFALTQIANHCLYPTIRYAIQRLR